MNPVKTLLGTILCLMGLWLFAKDFLFLSAFAGFIGALLLPSPATRLTGATMCLLGIWALAIQSSPLGVVFLLLGLFAISAHVGRGEGRSSGPFGGGFHSVGGDSWDFGGGGDGGGAGGGDGGGGGGC